MKVPKTIQRKFEIPYNFDFDLIKGLSLINFPADNIEYIYMIPHPSHYTSVTRDRTELINQLTLEEYKAHVEYVNSYYPGKLQLLLQQTDVDNIMDEETLQWYIDLGFTCFCCGTIKQAKIIKKINRSFAVVGSITMHIVKDELLENNDYLKYFDYFVLDFSYAKDLQKIKILPIGFKYMILVNSLCNSKCTGTYHWFKWKKGEPLSCPGLVNDVGFDSSCLIRPMDLKYFDPYIHVYKIQDRSWPTPDILRDLVLYSTDYSIYPGITYDEDLYER